MPGISDGPMQFEEDLEQIRDDISRIREDIDWDESVRAGFDELAWYTGIRAGVVNARRNDRRAFLLQQKKIFRENRKIPKD